MPKIQIVTDERTIQKYGGPRMYFCPAHRLRPGHGTGAAGQGGDGGGYPGTLPKNQADFTDPITAGIFVSIAAWASHQRSGDKTPYWRTLKANGELNPKYPRGVQAQRELLEAEGTPLWPGAGQICGTM